MIMDNLRAKAAAFDYGIPLIEVALTNLRPRSPLRNPPSGRNFNHI
jgi:hypothetical protein